MQAGGSIEKEALTWDSARPTFDLLRQSLAAVDLPPTAMEALERCISTVQAQGNEIESIKSDYNSLRAAMSKSCEGIESSLPALKQLSKTVEQDQAEARASMSELV